MKSILGLSLLAAAALASSPAIAAPVSADTPQRIGTCLYERYSDRAQRLLRAANAGDATRDYAKLSADTHCLTRATRGREYRPEDVPGTMGVLRGVLAEHALRQSAAAARALPALPLQQKRYVRPWFAVTGRNSVVDEMAACVADTNPAGVLGLLAASPTTSAEGAAMARLGSAFNQCLAAGTRVQADRRRVRAALADALYQRVQNPGLSLEPAAGTPQ